MRLSFVYELAEKYGIEEAILIDYFYNKMLANDCFDSGIRIMQKDIAEELICLTPRRVSFALKHLRDNGSIVAFRDKLVTRYTFSPELIEECKKYYDSGMIHPEKKGEDYEQKEDVD